MKPGTRILIVEDDRYIAWLLKLELEHQNPKVQCAYNGPWGLEAAREFELAAIVLDIMLPGMDGVGVLKNLRQRGNRVPIIMLTARDTSADKVHSLVLGAGLKKHWLDTGTQAPANMNTIHRLTDTGEIK